MLCFSASFSYVGRGVFQAQNASIKWGVQSWDANMVRYYFSLWFNRKGNEDINVWQHYGAVNKASAAPSELNPENSYFYLQPFTGNSWDEVFYFDSSLWDANYNERYSATISLYMNNTYGHATHGFSNIIDNKPSITGDLTIQGAGAVEPGQVFTPVNATTFNGDTSVSDVYGDTAGSTYSFEIFTSLTGGQPIYFQNGENLFGINGNGNVITLASTADATYTVSETGLYRIRLDPTLGNASVKKITKVAYFYCYDNLSVEMTYAGTGKWTIQKYEIACKFPWDNGTRIEERYKFKVTFDDGKVQDYGRMMNPGSRPQEGAAANRFYVLPSASGQWDATFKLPEWLVNNTTIKYKYVDITLYLNSDKEHYTHEFTNETN